MNNEFDEYGNEKQYNGDDNTRYIPPEQGAIPPDVNKEQKYAFSPSNEADINQEATYYNGQSYNPTYNSNVPITQQPTQDILNSNDDKYSYNPANEGYNTTIMTENTKKKKGKGVKIILIIALFIIVLFAIIFTSVFKALNVKEYKVNDMTIPTISSVTGNTNARPDSMKSNVSNGVTRKQYDYDYLSLSEDDINVYGTYLMSNEGFELVNTTDSMLQFIKTDPDNPENCLILSVGYASNESNNLVIRVLLEYASIDKVQFFGNNSDGANVHSYLLNKSI